MVVRRGIAVLAVVGLGACGTGTGTGTGSGTGSGRDAPQPMTRTTTVPAPADPTLTAKPPAAGTSLVGVAGGQDGCLTLSTGGTTWLLVGQVAGIGAGDRVTVRGSPAPDLATRCQQGTPFVVETVEPG